MSKPAQAGLEPHPSAPSLALSLGGGTQPALRGGPCAAAADLRRASRLCGWCSLTQWIRRVPLLEVKDLVVEFPHRRGTLRALDGVSFAIEPGEILGVVG